MGFRDQGEFREYRGRAASLLAARAGRDGDHATARRAVAIEGTCGVCLHPACFTATTEGGRVTPAGRVPQWRTTLACDCASALPAHQRALLQWLLGHVGVQPWFRVRLHGGAPRLGAALRAVARMTEAASQLDLVVACEALPEFAAVARGLAPGGHFVFTCPFDPDLPLGNDAVMGWDVLTRLRGAGFGVATAYHYWSEEFGYPGAANFLFAATL